MSAKRLHQILPLNQPLHREKKVNKGLNSLRRALFSPTVADAVPSFFVLVIENVFRSFSGFLCRPCLFSLGLAPSLFPSNFVLLSLLSHNSSLILFKTLLALHPYSNWPTPSPTNFIRFSSHLVPHTIRGLK